MRRTPPLPSIAAAVEYDWCFPPDAELRVNSKYDDARDRFAVSLEKGSGAVKKRVHLQEWQIHAPVAKAASDDKGKPTYSLHMVLRRKAGHFKNIMVLMGLMATVALG